MDLIEAWSAAGASVRGSSHVHTDTPCQDAHAHRVLGDNLVVVLADGAGSALQSREGAQRAVAVACDALSGTMARALPLTPDKWNQLMSRVFARTRAALAERAESGGLSAMATTLTCVVASSRQLVVAQLGDGVVAAIDRAGTLFSAVPPQRGEYANETVFLTAKDALERIDVQIYPGPVQALVATTDGLLRLALNSDCEPFAPFFEPLIRFVEGAGPGRSTEGKLAAFLQSERVCARTDDDKTLVVALRRED